jgi:hypothetical protein
MHSPLFSDQLDEIEQQIKKAVDAVACEPGHGDWKDAVWTKKIKNAIAMLGQARGLRTYASSAELANHGEWLYDLTWTDEPSGFLRSVPLVLEMEWTPNGVVDDFQKLVVARASHRVMLFNYTPGHDQVLFLDKILHSVTAFDETKEGDRYLFGGWINEEDRFDWHLVLVTDQ